MLTLHDDDRGAYDLDYSAGEYGLMHFADPDRTPSAVVLMSVETAVTVAQAILAKSAPHLLATAVTRSEHRMFAKHAGGPPTMAPMNDPRGNVVIFPRRA